MRKASLSEDNLWSAFSETGLSFPQLSVTSTADLQSPSSAVFSLYLWFEQDVLFFLFSSLGSTLNLPSTSEFVSFPFFSN